MSRPALLVIVVLLALLAAPLLLQGTGERPYQGWVEADRLFVGAEGAGRLAAVTVKEGETVAAGAPLFRLDDSSERAAVAAAHAQSDKAAAQLALARAAQKRPQEIAVLRASEREAEARLALAAQDLERTRTLFGNGTASRAALDGATATQAASAAALDNIRRQIDLGQLPERDERIAAAENDVAAAEAELAAATAALDRRAVVAATGGTIEEIYYRAGEVVPAGRPVVALLPPDNIRIRFFVPQAQLASVALGGRLRVRCDGCAPVAATVSFIAGSAEYTPPEIFSPEERAKLVFRVEAMPETPAALHVGQPVDVIVEGQAQGTVR